MAAEFLGLQRLELFASCKTFLHACFSGYKYLHYAHLTVVVPMKLREREGKPGAHNMSTTPELGAYVLSPVCRNCQPACKQKEWTTLGLRWA